jgi:GxxExxY protein
MHEPYPRSGELSREVIAAAIEVHRIMGPGLLESIYEKCLGHELTLRGIRWTRQQSVQVTYKDMGFCKDLRFDLLVDDCLLIELKAVETVHPIYKAQLLSYMKLLDVPVGLLLSFHEHRLVDGISRMILRGADR